MKGLKYHFFVILLFASSTVTYAQKSPALFTTVNPADSSHHSHLKQYNIKEETVVTATRTERKLSNVAIPTKIITQKSIKQAGSMRLSDILQEQSGLFLTSGFGTGVQMQGLNPDYTLIMINGEPLVGRTSGVLDLNRLAVGNIKKIEIVKGPSSSLYGSEAMAGVINIITDQTPNNKLATSLRYGTYNTKDFNCNTTFSKGKFTFSHFLNSYQSDGFSIRPYAVERTVAPIWRLTNQFHTSYQASAKTKIDIDLRYAYEHIQNEIAVTNNGIITYSKGNEYHKDFNLNPVITHLFSSKLKSTLRLYATNYNADQNLNTSGNSIYDDQLNHQFVRVENQTDYYLNDKISFNAGIGYVQEGVKSNRYELNSARRTNNINYVFAQTEIKPIEKITIIAGFRYDNNQLFAAAFSPKIAAMYKATEHLKFNASIGRGFKAPDFRQLYLNFTNTAAGGYSVFGALEAQKQIDFLQTIGQILSIESDYYKLKELHPEYATGINFGLQYNPNKQIQFDLSFFRNDVENLIDTRLVAYHKSGAQIFSYLNLKNAYTQGVESQMSVKITPQFAVSAGYQYLLTADKDQVKEIEAGRVYTIDAGGFARRMELSEYVGLPNRSKHMANFKLSYENENYFTNLRVIYRSKWAVNDKDGNGLYNSNDGFANAFAQINIAAGKQFNKQFRAQIGCDNIGNYIDMANLPNLAGRTFYTTLSYQFNQKNKK